MRRRTGGETLNVPQPTTYREYLELWKNSAYHSVCEKQDSPNPSGHHLRHPDARPVLDQVHRRSTEPVRKAAEAFLASLTPEQRKRTIILGEH
jgi:hypothetical protein